MPGSVREYLKRSLLPSMVIAASRVRGPGFAAARTARRLGRPITMEIYFAFDDPYAAIALPALLDLVRDKRVAVSLYPIVQRGIADDPSQLARTRHALVDASRLAQRQGQALKRAKPLDPEDCAFLAAWTTAARTEPAALLFAADALSLLWRDSDGPVSPTIFEALYRDRLKQAPPKPGDRQRVALQENVDRLHAKGHWESPAVRLAGEWLFAHERMGQIGRRLDELGA